MTHNLSEDLRKSIALLNYKELTDVQKQVIPLILSDKDVIVKSKTGSGKTASFAIPICEKINWDENQTQALILTPTRELATQIKDDIFNIGRFKRIKVSALYGRESFTRQAKEIKQKTHIVVGTPGRTFDHMERGTFDTSNIKYLVIDEADEMLSMGFIEQVEDIIKRLSKDRITILLSATMNEKIANISKKYMLNPTTVEIQEKVTTFSKVSQSFIKAYQDTKLSLLKDVTVAQNPDSCIIFCNTQIATDEVYDYLCQKNYSCNKIHGGIEQNQRNDVMNKFKRGEFRFLIATDVAARGIDIDDISLVINYDMPKKCETYVHRIGRTGRIGKEGNAVTFVTDIGMKSFAELQEFLSLELTFAQPPSDEQLKNAQIEFDKKLGLTPTIKESKGDKLCTDIMKIHINAGKKTKMRPVDVVGTLCSIDGMTAQDIGIINILDVSTFVEILNGKGKVVLKTLQTKPIKGRIRKVSIVDTI